MVAKKKKIKEGKRDRYTANAVFGLSQTANGYKCSIAELSEREIPQQNQIVLVTSSAVSTLPSSDRVVNSNSYSLSCHNNIDKSQKPPVRDSRHSYFSCSLKIIIHLCLLRLMILSALLASQWTEPRDLNQTQTRST